LVFWAASVVSFISQFYSLKTVVCFSIACLIGGDDLSGSIPLRGSSIVLPPVRSLDQLDLTEAHAVAELLELTHPNNFNRIIQQARKRGPYIYFV